MRRVHRVGKQHRLVSVQMVQQIFIGRDECRLLLRVELARHRFRLAMLHAKAVQQRDQAGPTLIRDATFLLDPGANLARRPRQRPADPDFQLVLLLAAQATRAALVAEARQTLDPLLLVQPMPGADRVVVQQQHLRHGFAAHAVVQQHQRVRSPGQTMRGRPVSSQLDQILPRFAVQEPRPYHQPGRIRFAPLGKGTGRILMESRYNT